jgi:hypothetical protein
MGRLYVASVLIAITGKTQTSKPVEAELAPIIPGAWAAWAKGWDSSAASDTAPTAVKAPVTSLQPAGSKA